MVSLKCLRISGGNVISCAGFYAIRHFLYYTIDTRTGTSRKVVYASYCGGNVTGIWDQFILLPKLSLLKPTSNFRCHTVWHSKILHCDHVELECFVWISEQTANFVLCKIKGLVFIIEVESVYCAVRTEYLYKTYTFLL